MTFTKVWTCCDCGIVTMKEPQKCGLCGCLCFEKHILEVQEL